ETGCASGGSIILGTKRGNYFAVCHFEFQNSEDVGAVLGTIPDHRNLIARLEHILGPPAPVQSAGIGELAVPFHDLAAVVGDIQKKLAMGIDEIEFHYCSLERSVFRCIVAPRPRVREYRARK